MFTLDSRRYWDAVRFWLITEVIICTIIFSVVAGSNIKALAFFIFAAAVICVAQVALTALLIWKIPRTRRVFSILIGAGAGFFIPIALLCLIGLLSWITDLFTAVLFAILGALYPSLVLGLVGGAWLGHVRWKLSAGPGHR